MIQIFKNRLSFLAILLPFLVMGAPGFSLAEVLASMPSKGPSGDTAARSYFTDTELTDQDGRVFKLYSDLIRDKKVLINFAFTSCKGGCSPITQNLVKVQRKLAGKLGPGALMLTISVDPAHDSPLALKKFADKFGVGPGWHFLSGSRANVEKVLRKLGGYTPDPDAHSMVLLIGDARTGMWTKANAMDEPEKIVRVFANINQ